MKSWHILNRNHIFWGDIFFFMYPYWLLSHDSSLDTNQKATSNQVSLFDIFRVREDVILDAYAFSLREDVESGKQYLSYVVRIDKQIGRSRSPQQAEKSVYAWHKRSPGN